MIPSRVREDDLRVLAESARTTKPISLGPRRTASPHEFYRYPGRFPPEFVRSAIETFSEPGDLVLDPFVGGGTTAVEAALTGRRALVADINPLATFVTRAKTTPLTASQLRLVRCWLDTIPTRAKVNQWAPVYEDWRSAGYLRHLESRATWRISKLIRIALVTLPAADAAVERFCRCIVLRTGQWALDMGRRIPTVSEFRSTLVSHGIGMVEAATKFSSRTLSDNSSLPVVLDAAVPGLSLHPRLRQMGSPNLIVTSPPYPGVYSLYHRWKVFGRKETPAPYWIADREDSNGMSHYTMSARTNDNLDKYFHRLHAAYSDISLISSCHTSLIQIVGFSDIKNQLPRFLEGMSAAGFTEFYLPPSLAKTSDQRLWRSVPGRRWWTQAHSRKSVTSQTAKEVVLFHRLT